MSFSEENKNKLTDFFQAIQEGDREEIESLLDYFLTTEIDPFSVEGLSKDVFDPKENTVMHHLTNFILKSSFDKDKKSEETCANYILFLQEKGLNVWIEPKKILPKKMSKANKEDYPYLSYLLHTEKKSIYNKAKKLIVTTLKIEENAPKNDIALAATLRRSIRLYDNKHKHIILPSLFNKFIEKDVLDDALFHLIPLPYHFANKIKKIDYAKMYKKQIEKNSLKNEAIYSIRSILFDDMTLNSAQKWFDFYKKSSIPFEYINENLIDYLFTGFNNKHADIDFFRNFLIEINSFNELLKKDNLKVSAHMFKNKYIKEKHYLKILDLFYSLICKDKIYSTKNNEQFFINLFNSFDISFTKNHILFSIFDNEIHFTEEEHPGEHNRRIDTHYPSEQFIYLYDKITNLKKINFEKEDLNNISKFYFETYGENSQMHKSLFNHDGLVKTGYEEEGYKKICHLFSHLNNNQKIEGILNIDEEYINNFNFFLIKLLLDERFIKKENLTQVCFKNKNTETTPLIEAFDNYIRLNILDINPSYFISLYKDNYKEKIINIFQYNHYTPEMLYYWRNTIECLKNLKTNPFEKDKNEATLFHSVMLFLHHNFNHQTPEELKDIFEQLITKWELNIPEDYEKFYFPELIKENKILPELIIVYEKKNLQYSLKIDRENENNIETKKKRL